MDSKFRGAYLPTCDSVRNKRSLTPDTLSRVVRKGKGDFGIVPAARPNSLNVLGRREFIAEERRGLHHSAAGGPDKRPSADRGSVYKYAPVMHCAPVTLLRLFMCSTLFQPV